MPNLFPIPLMQRATLLVPSGTDSNLDTKHLFIVLTDPHSNDLYPQPHCLMVNVSTVRAHITYDTACVLKPGDHPFVKQDSFVFYAKARVGSETKINAMISDGAFIRKEMLEQTVFERVVRGLYESVHTAPKHLRFYESACGG